MTGGMIAVYVLSSLGTALGFVVYLLLNAVDAGAPIFDTYMLIIPLSVVSIVLFFAAQSMAIAEGMFMNLDDDDDGESGI